MSILLQSVDKVLLVLGGVYLWLRQSRKAGAPSAAASSTKEQGMVVGMPAFEPVVVVQIPMCNERECYRQSITAACRLDWPQDKLVIQVRFRFFLVKTGLDFSPSNFISGGSCLGQNASSVVASAPPLAQDGPICSSWQEKPASCQRPLSWHDSPCWLV